MKPLQEWFEISPCVCQRRRSFLLFVRNKLEFHHPAHVLQWAPAACRGFIHSGSGPPSFTEVNSEGWPSSENTLTWPTVKNLRLKHRENLFPLGVGLHYFSVQPVAKLASVMRVFQIIITSPIHTFIHPTIHTFITIPPYFNSSIHLQYPPPLHPSIYAYTNPSLPSSIHLYFHPSKATEGQNNSKHLWRV